MHLCGIREWHCWEEGGKWDLVLIYGSHGLGGTQWGIKVPCACLVIRQTPSLCVEECIPAQACWCLKAKQLFREAKVLGIVLLTSSYRELQIQWHSFSALLHLSVINYDANSCTWLARDKHVVDFRHYITLDIISMRNESLTNLNVIYFTRHL